MVTPRIGKKSSPTVWMRISSGSAGPTRLVELKKTGLMASKTWLRARQSKKLAFRDDVDGVAAVRAGFPYHDKAVGLGEGQGAQDDGADDAVECGVSADAERDGEDGDEGEGGIAGEDAERVAEVSEHDVIYARRGVCFNKELAPPPAETDDIFGN
jgi:hypothetical protein